LLLALYIDDVVVSIVPDRVLDVGVVILEGELLAGEAVVVGVEAVVNLPGS